MTITAGKTIPEKTPPTQTKGESAVRHLWKQAIDDGDEAKAKLIATIANLLQPEIKLAAGAEVPAKTDPKPATVSASVDGTEVDISGMSTSDAEAYRQYAAEMDGSAALERHIATLEEEDAEMTAIFGRRDGS